MDRKIHYSIIFKSQILFKCILGWFLTNSRMRDKDYEIWLFLTFTYFMFSFYHKNFFFSEIDLIPAFATFFSCLFWALEWGILVGVGIQVLVILYHVARPVVNVDLKKLVGFKNSEKGQFLFVKLDRALIFPSISYVR